MQVKHSGNRYVAISTYDERMIPKEAGFRWDPNQKQWWTDRPETAQKLASYCDDSARKMIEDALAEREQIIEQSAATDAEIEIPAPEGLSYLPYQKAGIAYAMDRPMTLIGDEMGLGKTIQAIGIINADTSIKRVLVICPASLRLNWQREIDKWLTRLMSIHVVESTWKPADIMILNYEKARKFRSQLRAHEWDLIVADECHYLKNPKAQRTAEVLGKWNRDPAKVISPIPAKRRIFMTGTPIVNRPIELFPILNSTGLPEWKSWKYFATRYCNGHQDRYGWDVSGASNLDELQTKLRATVMVRRLKADVLKDLPAKRRQIIEIPANGASCAIKAEQKVLDKLRALMDASESTDDYRDAVENIQSGNEILFEEISRIRHETAKAKIPAVLDHLLESADSSGKVVVMAHHHDVINALSDGLREQSIDHVTLTGETPMDARQANVDRFQSDPQCKVFIGSIRAAGVGITLTTASHVIFAELDWVPGIVSQAEDRCHRIGQSESVLVQHLVLAGSLDAQIARAIVEKQEIISAALDNPTEAGMVPLDWGTLIGTPKAKSPRKAKEVTEPKLSESEIAEIHARVQYLAGMCDHAAAQDGMGFNKFDAEFGHALANAESLTQNQAVAAKRMIAKYKRQ